MVHTLQHRLADARKGNTTQAVSFLEKAVALMSDNAEVIAALGSALKENGDYEKREKTHGNRYEARCSLYFNLATIFRDQGDLARKKYHEALRLQNNFLKLITI